MNYNKQDKIQKAWYLIIIYNKNEVETTSTNVMSIDIGLDNLATITFKDGINQYIYCGKKLKSVNSYINKRISYLHFRE